METSMKKRGEQSTAKNKHINPTFNPATGSYAQPLRQLPKKELFRLVDSETAPVWVRDYWDPSERKYCCYKYDDVNHWCFFPGNKVVYTGFTY